jgi:hypothetical protein
MIIFPLLIFICISWGYSLSADTNMSSNIQPLQSKSNYLGDIDIKCINSLLVAKYQAYPFYRPLIEISNYNIIQDHEYVKQIFRKLQQSEVVSAIDLMFDTGIPILFLDNNADVVCGFRYCQAARPAEVFQLHRAYKREGKYYCEGKMAKGMILATNANGKLEIKDSISIPGFYHSLSRRLAVSK